MKKTNEKSALGKCTKTKSDDWTPDDPQVLLAKLLQREFGICDTGLTDIREIADMIGRYFPKKK